MIENRSRLLRGFRWLELIFTTEFIWLLVAFCALALVAGVWRLCAGPWHPQSREDDKDPLRVSVLRRRAPCRG